MSVRLYISCFVVFSLARKLCRRVSVAQINVSIEQVARSRCQLNSEVFLCRRADDEREVRFDRQAPLLRHCIQKLSTRSLIRPAPHLRTFAFPYFSRDIAEFWRRWHITLSRFLKDYVYIPLGGNKKGNFRIKSEVYSF